MELKECYSIDEIEGKHFKIKIVESSEKKAILTHYLHNIHNGAAKYFKKDALNSIKKLVEYKIPKEKLLVIALEILRYILHYGV